MFDFFNGAFNFCSKIVSTKPTKTLPNKQKIFLIQGYCFNYKLGLTNRFTPWLRRKYQLSRVTRSFEIYNPDLNPGMFNPDWNPETYYPGLNSEIYNPG